MADEFATKGDVAAAVTASEIRILEHIDLVKTGLLEHIDLVKTGLLEHIDLVKTEMLERIEKSENNLLTAFHDYARAAEKRTLVLEITASGLTERLAAVETRVRELEKKAAGL